jgi:uncharacterized protein (DUF779 family)
VATPAAVAAIGDLHRRYPQVLFYQSGGCCAGSTPMRFAAGEFRLGANDVRLGEIGGCPVYIDKRQYELWRHTQIIIDVGSGEPEGFSLPAGDDDTHFATRSRAFTSAELTMLE